MTYSQNTFNHSNIKQNQLNSFKCTKLNGRNENDVSKGSLINPVLCKSNYVSVHSSFYELVFWITRFKLNRSNDPFCWTLLTSSEQFVKTIRSLGLIV